MTAAVGFTTLRLIRYAIGPVTLDGQPGESAEIDEQQLWSLCPVNSKRQAGNSKKLNRDWQQRKIKR